MALSIRPPLSNSAAVQPANRCAIGAVDVRFRARAQAFDEDLERGRILPPAWVVEEETVGQRRRILIEQRNKLALGNQRRNAVEMAVVNADAVERRTRGKILVIDHDRAFDVDLDDLARLGESPRLQRATRKPAADAIVRQQVLRNDGRTASRNIVRRGDRQKSHTVHDADRDHVAIHAIADADAGIEARGDDVGDRAINGNFKRDLRVPFEKFRQHWRQHLARHRRRHGNAQPPCGLVAERVDRFDRLFDSHKQRAQALQQLLARLGQRNAARRAIEQSHA